MPLRENDIEPYARTLKDLIEKALDMQEEILRIVAAINFTTEDWDNMFKKHRLLAHELSALDFKYGSE